MGQQTKAHSNKTNMQTMDTFFFYGNPIIICILAIVYFMIHIYIKYTIWHVIPQYNKQCIHIQLIFIIFKKNQFKKFFVANLHERVKVSNR